MFQKDLNDFQHDFQNSGYMLLTKCINRFTFVLDSYLLSHRV